MKKVQECFEDYGCGFLVFLQNVPMIYVREAWTPDIDYNKLQEEVVRALAHKPSRLTGNQLKFIRFSLTISVQEWSWIFGLTTDEVVTYEHAGDDIPPMSSLIDRELRLFILYVLGSSSETLGEMYKKLQAEDGRRVSRTGVWTGDKTTCEDDCVLAVDFDDSGLKAALGWNIRWTLRGSLRGQTSKR